MSITKAHLADSIHNQLGLHKNQSVKVLESILEIIKETLENGEDVMITGFGKFYVREKRGRRGRNPATGEDLMLGSRRVVGFKRSDKLRNMTNILKNAGPPKTKNLFG
ncbi:Integration host factor subunit alpha [subsurface metagenome]